MPGAEVALISRKVDEVLAERLAPGFEVLHSNTAQADDHFVTTVIYRTAPREHTIYPLGRPQRVHQRTIRADVFVDGEYRNGAVVELSTEVVE